MGLGSLVKKVVGIGASAVGAATGNPALGALGSGISGLMSADASNANSAQAAAQSYKQTKEMMQNRHQWEVADLRAAGLNPTLSAGGTPSMGNSPMATTSDIGDNISKMSNSALASQRLKADLENIRAQTGKIHSDTALNEALKVSAGADALLKSNSARAAAANARSIEATIPGTTARSNVLNLLNKPTAAIGTAMDWTTNRIGKNIFDVWDHFQRKGK